MKKIAKLLMVGLLAISLVLTGVLVACSPDEETPGPGPIGGGEVEITDGRWTNKDSDVFLKLKEDGTFYMAGMFKYDAGTYELKEGSFAYYKIEMGSTPSDTDTDKNKYTADQQLVMTAYDGTVYTAAYADGILWNCVFPTPAGTMARTIRQEADYAWDPAKDEANTVEVVRVSLPKDQNSTLILIHNKTFEDSINGEEGTWEQTEGGYALKTSDGTEYGTLTAVTDGKCTLTMAEGDTTVELYETAWTPVYTLSATAVAATIEGDDVTGNASLRLWEDESADLTYTVRDGFSAETYQLLSGTYEEKGDGSLSITFENMEAISTTVPDPDGNVSFTVTVPVGGVLAAPVTITLSGVGGVTVEYEFTAADVMVKGVPGPGMDGGVASDLTLSLYSDNTAELKVVLKVATGMSYETVADTGTYTVDNAGMIPAITIDFANAGPLTTAPDYDSATPTSVDLKLAYTAENLKCFVAMGPGVELQLTFTATLRYTYVYQLSAA